MDPPEKVMLSQTFLRVQHANSADYQGPYQRINGTPCRICCEKTNKSKWRCSLDVWVAQPTRWKIVYKIRTNNGAETVGTRDIRFQDGTWVSFGDDPKYFVEGNLTIECHVEVYDMIVKEIRTPPPVIEKKTEIIESVTVTPRLFDESVKEFIDVVLVVEKKKFYVNKLFLASESSYFKSLLIGSFEESKKDEISLKDVEAKYFQLFLESLYGDRVICDETVDGILKLADMFDGKRVFEKCRFYLINYSRKSLKQKLDLAAQYNLNELKRKCLEDVKTVEDIRSVISDNLEEMDHDVLASLFGKLLELNN